GRVRDGANAEGAGGVRVIGHAREVYVGLDDAGVLLQRLDARLFRHDCGVAGRAVWRARVVVEVPRVLFEHAADRIFKFVHTGVAGALKQQLRIGGQVEGLVPGAADFREVRLDGAGRLCSGYWDG